MSGNISRFISDINKHGIAKTSHFDVDFNLPLALLPDTKTPRILKMRCESAELPGRQIGTTDNRIYGPIYKTPFDSIYAEMTMTFVDTADMAIRTFFETWVDQIFNSETNTISYIDDIVSDIFVTQYDVAGTPDTLNPVISFRLIRAFPVNINQLGVSWGDDAAHKLAVGFFYERYTIVEWGNQVFSTVDSLKEIANGPNQEGLGKSITNNAQIELERERAITIAAGLNQEGLGRQIVANTQVQLEMQKAQTIANSSKRTDTGLLGQVVQDIATKVKNLF